MKKKMRWFLLSLVAPISLFAQQEKCGTMRVLDEYLQNNPSAAADYAATKLRWENEDVAHPDSRAFVDTIFIPVVFHIVHNGDAYGTGENIVDEACYTQIDALNKSFNLQNAQVPNIPQEFKSVAARTRILFCLAQKDPQGNYTTGIKRYDLGQATWDDETSIDGTLKPSTIWDRNKYLNIWSARFGGDIASRGVLAYAQFPGWGAANSDGVIARFNVIGTVGALLSGYATGNTLVHEVGHWLGLFHIWGDDSGACTGSDQINDTPNQGDQYFGCPTYPQTSCGSSDMFMNFMDYTNDDCMSMFTTGQSTRMRNTLSTTRSGIKSSIGNCFYSVDAVATELVSPTDSMCATDFQPTFKVKNNGLTDIASFSVSYTVDGNNYSYNWSGSLPLFAKTTVILPRIANIGAGNHTFSATVNNINGGSTDNVPANNVVSKNFYVNPTTVGFATPFVEDFEFGSISSDWNVINPNNDVTWNSASVSARGAGNYSFFINNRNYTVYPNGKRDYLVTAAYDISNLKNVALSFDLAYAKRGTRYDTLKVAYSIDCGKSWTNIWVNGGQSMATSANETPTLFVPSVDSEWVNHSIALDYLSNQQNVIFRFENDSYWGHALYLDNINLSGLPTGISEAENSKVKIELYPNPAKNILAVRLEDDHTFNSYAIYNVVGQKIKTATINNTTIAVPVEDLSNGNYFIHFQGDKKSQVEKIIIAR